MTKPPAREVATARPVPSPLSLQAKAKATSRPVPKPVARTVPPAKRPAPAPRVRTPPGPVAAELPHTGVVCRPRPNSRVTSRQIDRRLANASAPESLETAACDPRVMGGMLWVSVPEVILDQAEVVATVGEVEAARVAQHVRVDRR